jgi:4-amino-4-deoxy-L-arabinose transferase-like glycosyltransferase
MARIQSKSAASRLHHPDIWLLAILAMHGLLAFLLFNPQPFTGGDNAHYMILAESIGTGQGYRDLHVVGAPVHAKYPPLYPVVLAGAQSLGGGIASFKTLSAVFTTASLAFLFLLGRRRLGRKSALLVTAVAALNPVVLQYSHWVLSEALFVLLVLAAMWAFEREDDDWRWVGLAIAAAVLAYLTRTAGLALLLALLVSLGWQKRWVRLGATGLVTVSVIGAWSRWVATAVASGAQGYGVDFLRIDPYAADQGLIGPGQLLRRMLVNAWMYATTVLPETLGGDVPGTASAVNAFASIVAMVVVGTALMGWWRGIRHGRVLELFALFYTGLILAWPPMWTDARFLLPLLPVLLLLSVDGIVGAFALANRKPQAWVIPLFAASLMLLSLPANVQWVSATVACHEDFRRGDELACYNPLWRSFVVSALWVRDETPADAVVVSRKPRMFFYFARRQTAPFPLLGDDVEKLAAFESAGAGYVVISATTPGSDIFLVPLILRNPDRFRPLFDTGADPFTAHVLQVVGEN